MSLEQKTAPAATRWVRRPEGSNWGEFGPEDRLGRLNLIGDAQRRAAAREVIEGRAFCLSLPLEIGPGLNASRLPPRLKPLELAGRPKLDLCACHLHPGLTDVICDDQVTLCTQYSTQWDSLCHAGSMFDADGDGVPEVRYYNGFGAAQEGGASALGIAHMAATCVQGRGVLLDLQRHFGDGRTGVGYDSLMRLLERDRIAVESGDMVCLHTGFAERLLQGERDPAVLGGFGAVLDGRDARLLRWITDSGLSVLVADNVAVEARGEPPPAGYAGPLMPLHEHCIFKLGIHLGELWHLTPLAQWLQAHGRHRFLLTAPPLRLAGAAGSPVTPVATV